MSVLNLTEALDGLAAADSLLVCVDFDGTISELVPEPDAARPHPVALDAIRALSQLPATRVAVLSGRHLAGLGGVFPLREPVVLVGSHGAEPAAGAPKLSDDDAAFLQRVQDRLEAICIPPAFVERKPYQRVMHVGALAEIDADAAAALLARSLDIDGEGRPVTQGHNVVEFSAVDITKGDWLADYKEGFSATLFAGDDTTDETAMTVLGDGDVGIKVGPKPTCAALRLATVEDMAFFLRDLAAARAARYMFGPARTPSRGGSAGRAGGGRGGRR